jgi:hypothetical protein
MFGMPRVDLPPLAPTRWATFPGGDLRVLWVATARRDAHAFLEHPLRQGGTRNTIMETDFGSECADTLRRDLVNAANPI